jgi:hypothetical protein
VRNTSASSKFDIAEHSPSLQRMFDRTDHGDPVGEVPHAQIASNVDTGTGRAGGHLVDREVRCQPFPIPPGSIAVPVGSVIS